MARAGAHAGPTYAPVHGDSQPMATTHAPRARAAAWAGCAADLTPAFARTWWTTRSPSLASLSLPLGSTKMVPSDKLFLCKSRMEKSTQDEAVKELRSGDGSKPDKNQTPLVACGMMHKESRTRV